MNNNSQPDPDKLADSICDSEGLTPVAEIGSGSFKSVYHVKRENGESVALKLVRNPRASPRVAREIEAGRRADHPNIANIFHVGVHEFEGAEFDYYLEEYLEGGSLADRLENGREFDRGQIIDIGSPLISSLSHLNELGLVHRDIKPANVIFRGDSVDTPVLVDFGLVRDIASTSLTPSWIDRGPGTPYYSSPEQLNNEKDLIDWRSDQFSLAVVLYLSLTKSHPYQRANESLWVPETVERVAAREERPERFEKACETHSLTCLKIMARSWPAQRYRIPDKLADAWAQQGDS